MLSFLTVMIVFMVLLLAAGCTIVFIGGFIYYSCKFTFEMLRTAKEVIDANPITISPNLMFSFLVAFTVVLLFLYISKNATGFFFTYGSALGLLMILFYCLYQVKEACRQTPKIS